MAITALTAGLCRFAVASTLQVNPGGGSGAYPTIGAAVQQATAAYAQSAVDTIYVAPGTYREGVTIGTPLSLGGRLRPIRHRRGGPTQRDLHRWD